MAGFSVKDIAQPGDLESALERSLSSSSGTTAPESPAPINSAKRDPWIFRDGKTKISARTALLGIRSGVDRGSPGWIDALIQAGEMEAALADVSHPDASASSSLSDALAEAVLTGEHAHIANARKILAVLRPPEWIHVSPPEGFTYYALHPLDFAEIASREFSERRKYALIGIRSIGTTLSAMMLASLRQAGSSVSRTTVRPEGHPYSRKAEFSSDQQRWIEERSSEDCEFIIVDEGPGRSGSTFLSVAEALVLAGVDRNRITMVGSRYPDLSSLCAEDAAKRWAGFRFLATSPSVNQRFADFIYAGGGCWREILLADAAPWPESWTQMERLKFISPDHSRIFKFEGMGRIGAEVRSRAFALAESGFIPQVSNAGDGFLDYELHPAKQLSLGDVSSELLDQMAAYCAFRAASFAEPLHSSIQLGSMVEFNAEQEFGVKLDVTEDDLFPDLPVNVDGRMQPYEWIVLPSGKFVKTDAVDHGDNHFFPGPCDIAWDIAGIIVEWRLNDAHVRRLLQEFRRLSGVQLTQRLPAYLLAYTVFRLSFCKMARDTVRGSPDEPRLHAAYAHYRAQASDLIALLQKSR